MRLGNSKSLFIIKKYGLNVGIKAFWYTKYFNYNWHTNSHTNNEVYKNINQFRKLLKDSDLEKAMILQKFRPF